MMDKKEQIVWVLSDFDCWLIYNNNFLDFSKNYSGFEQMLTIIYGVSICGLTKYLISFLSQHHLIVY